MKKQKRAMVVFAGLVTVLSGTSALLLAVSSEQLKPDAQLRAGSAAMAVSGVTDTSVPVQPGRWTSIYVRHSRTAPGDLRTLGANPGDHFVVASGNPAIDGQIQMTLRWSNQASATPPAGVKSIDPRCITIVVMGDLDKNVPTPAQLRRTTELVQALQSQFNIPAAKVTLLGDARNSPAGTGRFFPTAAFRESLLQ